MMERTMSRKERWRITPVQMRTRQRKLLKKMMLRSVCLHLVLVGEVGEDLKQTEVAVGAVVVMATAVAMLVTEGAAESIVGVGLSVGPALTAKRTMVVRVLVLRKRSPSIGCGPRMRKVRVLRRPVQILSEKIGQQKRWVVLASLAEMRLKTKKRKAPSLLEGSLHGEVVEVRWR